MPIRNFSNSFSLIIQRNLAKTDPAHMPLFSFPTILSVRSKSNMHEARIGRRSATSCCGRRASSPGLWENSASRPSTVPIACISVVSFKTSEGAYRQSLMNPSAKTIARTPMAAMDAMDTVTLRGSVMVSARILAQGTSVASPNQCKIVGKSNRYQSSSSIFGTVTPCCAIEIDMIFDSLELSQPQWNIDMYIFLQAVHHTCYCKTTVSPSRSTPKFIVYLQCHDDHQTSHHQSQLQTP